MYRRLFKGKGGAGGCARAAAVQHHAAPTGAPVISAIERMGEVEDLLTRRRDLLEKKIAAELQRAKELTKQGKKKAALAALRKKRLFEGQLEQVEANLLRLSEQQVGLESVRATSETVAAMRVGAQASKAATAEVGVQGVDALIDELEDQAMAMRQVQDVLGSPLGAAAELDEDELAAELEEMELAEVEKLRQQAATAPSHQAAAPALPSTPTARPQAARVQPQPASPEEQELEALQAEMAA